jgi:pimeloyl-ACP methyl ester carboxylesterase
MKQKGKLMIWIIPIVLIGLALFLYLPYRRDIRKAYAHLESIERQVVSTECGPIEVAIRGEGEPILVSHGIGGGFDQGLGLADAYLGDGYRVIAPSRFGYHSTPLATDASPASQAGAFVCLLDALEIEKSVIVANSAGGPSALQMALRHPERIQALVLISTAAPTVGEYLTLPPRPMIQSVFSSDFLMWTITTHFQSMMRPVVGVPDGYQLSEEEQRMVSGVITGILPIRPRTAGFVFDMFTSNKDMDQHPDLYPMEEISVPVMIIHAVDDSLAAYKNAEALASRIPHAELLSLSKGGHLLLSQGETVRSEIARFIKSIH